MPRRPDERAQVESALIACIRAVSAEPGVAGREAEAMLGGVGPARRRLVAAEMARLLDRQLGCLVAHGWTPVDLAEISRRRAAGVHIPALTALLGEHAGRFAPSAVAPAWRAQIADLGPAAAANPERREGLAALLTLAGVLDHLPAVAETIPPPGCPGVGRDIPGPREAVGESEAKQLARVRALLAKAESTTYDAEAEALTEKAQELITRYALQRLLAQVDSGAAPTAVHVTARRIWIDAPYVLAKAMLIAAVGSANRCSAITSDSLGCVTVVGAPRDLDAVELLSTSLLVQANAAMLRQGRQAARDGASRTRPFRQSFLVAYGDRIGERLRDSGTAAAAAAGSRERLLPVLRAVEEAVQEEFTRLFPTTVYRSASVNDARGWAAGRAAADLARLEVHQQVAAG